MTQPAITLYSKNFCQPCKATKRKLDELGLDYREINVDEDEAARAYIVGLGFRESPVLIASDGRQWSGYQPSEIAALTRSGA